MEIAIALDSYDDLFSDFDVRGYGERAISKDFLDELNIRLLKSGRRGEADIVFLMPASMRNRADEPLILGRIEAFFSERCAHYRDQVGKTLLRSALFVATGLGLSFAANVLVERLSMDPIFRDFLLIPAWFFVWNGLEMFIKSRGEIRRKSEYYGMLRASRTVFRDLETFRGK